MPAARHRSRSSRRAPAVMAMIGVCAAGAFLGPNGRRGLVAVHLRHLAVHQDGVVGLRRDCLDRGRTVGHRVRRGSRRSESIATATFWLIRLSSARSRRPSLASLRHEVARRRGRVRRRPRRCAAAIPGRTRCARTSEAPPGGPAWTATARHADVAGRSPSSRSLAETGHEHHTASSPDRRRSRSSSSSPSIPGMDRSSSATAKVRPFGAAPCAAARARPRPESAVVTRHAPVAEVLRQDAALGRVVVDDERGDPAPDRGRVTGGRAARLPGSACTRIVNQKVLPSPSRLDTPQSPPISATSCLLIASPRPVPPYLRDVEVSACDERLEDERRACPGAMPIAGVGDLEADDGVAVRRPRSGDAHARSRPPAVNLIALPIRLVSTWRTRPGSPRSDAGTSSVDDGTTSSSPFACAGPRRAGRTTSSTMASQVELDVLRSRACRLRSSRSRGCR